MVDGWWTRDKALRDEVLAAVPRLQRHSFADFTPPRAPGAYMLWIASERLLAAHHLGAMAALFSGEIAAYCGSAQRGLRARLGRYRQSLAGMLRVDELYVAVLPTASAAAALFAESVLIEVLAPPLNSTSLGCKIPGRNRQGQKLAMLEALLGGRHWAAREPTPVERAQALVQLALRLGRVPDDAPRRPPLVTPTAPKDSADWAGRPGELRVIGGGRR